MLFYKCDRISENENCISASPTRCTDVELARQLLASDLARLRAHEGNAMFMLSILAFGVRKQKYCYQALTTIFCVRDDVAVNQDRIVDDAFWAHVGKKLYSSK